MNRIKAVIFDLNGVFLQSEYLTTRMAEKYNIDDKELFEALKEVMAIARKPGIDDSFVYWEPHLKKLGLNISRDEFFNFWFSGEKLVPEFLDFCKELRRKKLKVFILSNNFKERIEYYRSHFPEIFNSVDKAYFSWEVGYVKPSPEAFQNILNENNLKASECIYFDDSTENVEMAKSLGINAYKYKSFEDTKNTVEKLGQFSKQPSATP